MRSSFAPIHGYVATYIRKVNNFRRSFPDCEISSAICLAKTQKFRIIIDNCKGQFYWITKAKGVLKFSNPLKKMFLWHFLDRFVREYLSDLAEKNCDEGRCYSTCLFTATYYSCRKKCCGM